MSARHEAIVAEAPPRARRRPRELWGHQGCARAGAFAAGINALRRVGVSLQMPPDVTLSRGSLPALAASGAVANSLVRSMVGTAPLARLAGTMHGLRLEGRGKRGTWLVCSILLALAGCDPRSDSGPVLVSAIGGRPTLAEAGRGAAGAPSRLLADAVAQGLVRFDAAGQIEPGLAERWIVIDGGASYIFRLRDARWADGAPVTAEQVVARLKRQIAPGSRNPLAAFLTAIDEIVAMTPQVIEVRLSRPRPDLLKLFAQPELAIIRLTRPAGSGPFQPASGGTGLLLRPVPDPTRVDPDNAPTPSPAQEVRLTGESAGMAVARFAAGTADLVAGGTFADWPLAQAARAPTAQLRVDPAAGLFGLSVVSRTGFLSDAANRAAVAEAIDGGAATFAVAPAWAADERLLPEQLDSAAPPQLVAWSGLSLDQRRAAARRRVAGYGEPVRLRVALPAGSGATRLWGQVARALLLVGITAERVALNAPAELRLLDAVAPYDSARWYLATACQPCGYEAHAQLEAAREALTLADRAQRIAAADAALAADVAYIPLARPLRWSLVSPRLRAWQPNARAWHPLNRLRNDPT